MKIGNDIGPKSVIWTSVQEAIDSSWVVIQKTGEIGYTIKLACMPIRTFNNIYYGV